MNAEQKERARLRQRIYRKAHPEKFKIHRKTYYLLHRDEILARHKRWCLAHREERLKKRKDYYFAHHDEYLAKSKAYNLKHRDKILAKNKIYSNIHREELRAYKKARYLIHRDEYRAKSKIYRDSHPGWEKKKRLKNKYGITLAEFDLLLINQGGVCAICGKAEWNSSGPHIDHDHVTGKVRGLLCNRCNISLGIIHDDLDVVKGMADYLIKFK